MFRLTREVRLAIGPRGELPAVTNGHAGYPPLEGMGCFLTVQVTLGGEIDPVSGYLMNIKQIDQGVRREGRMVLEEYARHRPKAAAAMAQALFERLRQLWPRLERAGVGLSPFTSFSVRATEHPMVRLSHKFEFSAAHRLHNPQLDEQANAALFGKCNNPHGHGHNYELEVTLRGRPDANGQIMPVHVLEEIVMSTVIQKFDHTFLNIQTPEFATVNPTVENIARVIYGLLKPRLRERQAELAAVTVWETPKTWCEYQETGD